VTIYSINSDSTTSVVASTSYDLWVLDEGVTLATAGSAIDASAEANSRHFIVAGDIVANAGRGIDLGAGIGSKITISDTGSIYSDQIGISVYDPDGSDVEIRNEGDVYGYGYGVYAQVDRLVLTNDGTISSFTAIASKSIQNLITNHGTINGGLGFLANDPSGDNQIYNTGVINGAIQIDSHTSLTNTVFNSGTITSAVAFSCGWAMENIENTGTIKGNIFLSLGDDTVANSGSITGNLDLAGDNDTFILLGNGLIEGFVDMGAGDDTIILANANVSDYVTGGAGDDYYKVRLGDIALIEGTDEGTDTVATDLTWHLEDNFENLTLTGNASVNGHGNTLDNALTGNRGANQLFGSRGTDTLNGMAGADRLDGGADLDTASYQNAKALEGVLIDLARGTGTGGDAQGDRLIGIENVTGSILDDTLRGGAGENILSGSDGNDALDGRGGFDLLRGGNGSDAFVFATGYGHDTIEDFVVSGDMQDAINLAGLVGVENFRDLKKSHMQAVGDDVVITGDKGDTLTIMDVTMKELTASDFIF
jgi:serralysin